MKKALLKAVAVIICAATVAAVLFSTTIAAGIAGDVNRDGSVDNKDVVVLFRRVSGSVQDDIDEIACDVNGDGEIDNKDVVLLFRHVSNPDIEIFYGKETESETEDITETEDISETEKPEDPVQLDNVFTEWNDSVKDTFTNLKQTEISYSKDALNLKFTGTNSADPRVTFDIAQYAKLKEKRELTGTDASYMVFKIKSNTDGDLQIFEKSTGGTTNTAYYKPDGQFHYVIVDLTGTKIVKAEKLSTVRIDWASGKTQTGAEATITEIGFFADLDEALDYCAVIAGTDSGIVRDGTPKKYITMSFDDGTQQDIRIIEILKKYGIDKATFFINTGLGGADWSSALGVSHVRFTMDELKTGIYDGYDVECHTLTHPSMKAYDNNPAELKRQIVGDCINIFNLTGRYPAGLAWPGGDGDQTETTRKLVYENTNLRFGRGINFNANFKVPTEFLLWEPTCSAYGNKYLLKKFLKKECTEDMLFYMFAHGFELDLHNSWDSFEDMIKMISEAEDVVIVTNAEFYQLFKDEIPAFVPTK